MRGTLGLIRRWGKQQPEKKRDPRNKDTAGVEPKKEAPATQEAEPAKQVPPHPPQLKGVGASLAMRTKIFASMDSDKSGAVPFKEYMVHTVRNLAVTVSNKPTKGCHYPQASRAGQVARRVPGGSASSCSRKSGTRLMAARAKPTSSSVASPRISGVSSRCCPVGACGPTGRWQLPA